MRVLLYDKTQTGWPFLSTWWALGSLVSGADVVIGVRSWGEAYRRLGALVGPLDLLMFWGHGNDGAAYIDGVNVRVPELAASLPPTGAIWWRACETHRGIRGQNFATDVVERTGADSVGHCEIVAAPNPFRQRAICALRPGEVPWWPITGTGLRSCSTLRMTVPTWAYAPP